jgi:GT2 family glycosyltransferase
MQSSRGSGLSDFSGGYEDFMRISVIIPTKNRKEDLQSTLEDLAAQTRRPDEVLIVDQSPIPSFEPSGVQIAVNYIHAPNISGAATARNVAMDCAIGDLWIFLDDDVILEPQYIDEIVRAYTPEIAGVSGIITNYSVPPFTRRLFDKLFVRGAFSDDRQPVYWHANELRYKGPQKVRQFGCGVMSFRAEVIRNLRFDPKLTGGSLAEDIDYCAHLPRGSQLVIAPNARLIHKMSAVGRATGHWLEAHSQSSYYMRQRNWHRGMGDDLSFAWLRIGYTVMAAIGSIKRGSLEPFRAWRRGATRGRSLGSRESILPTSSCARETVTQG